MRTLAITAAATVTLAGGLALVPPAQAAGACAPTISLGNLTLDDLGTASYTITVTASPIGEQLGGCSGTATFVVDGFESYLDPGETNTYPGRSIYACGRTITGTVQQGGTTVTSNPLNVGFLPPYKPATPNLVSAQSTSLTASWPTNTDTCHPVTGYQLTSGLGGQVASTVGSQATLTGLTPATAYSVSVIATNSAGSTQGDARSMSTTASPVATPSAPQNLAASSLQTTSARLTWSAPASTGTAAVTGYVVSLNGTRVTTVTGSSADLSGLTANTGYTATVSAVNSAGTGPAASVTFRTAAPAAPTQVPGAVINLRVSAKNSTSAVLDWAPPASDGGSPVTGYLVVNQTTGEQRQLSATTTETAFTLSPATTYVFAVTARNAKGSGPATTTSVTTDPQGSSDRATQTIAVDVHTGKAWRSGQQHAVGAVRSSAGVAVRWTATGSWVKSYTVTRQGNEAYITVVLKKGAPKVVHVTINATAAAAPGYDRAHIANGVRVHR